MGDVNMARKTLKRQASEEIVSSEEDGISAGHVTIGEEGKNEIYGATIVRRDQERRREKISCRDRRLIKDENVPYDFFYLLHPGPRVVSVDEIGFESLINDLRTKYLFPLSHYFFPEWTGSSLDSHRAFVVKYKVGEDIDLSYHYDNSEVTLNVSLNNDYIGGELFFGPMRYEDSTLKFGYEHKKGEGVLHRGQQMHGAFPITEGER
ncbi:2-oxoglutarate and iron-dependent oxygenase domain-containing protein 2 [Armadillidium vulgare]|nr:2-oxoglutarate and iron-dependent oxygenase domain-containing protein 2 [Armadillidium vulgare]